MKKLILLFAYCSLFGRMEAQQVIPVKEKLVVDYFNYEPYLSPIYAEMFRSEVCHGFMRRGHHEVIKASQIAGMRVTPEMLFTAPDMGLLQQARITACHDSGARWLVWGDLSDYHCLTEIVDEKREYNYSITLTLMGMDLLSGETLPAESILLTGSGQDQLNAKEQMISLLSIKIKPYINKYYKIDALILHIEPANSKGKYKELYINCGTNMGLRPGDLFVIYHMDEINGARLPRQIGKIRVRDVTNYQASLCTIVNGGEEIAAAVKAGLNVVAQSAGRSLF